MLKDEFVPQSNLNGSAVAGEDAVARAKMWPKDIILDRFETFHKLIRFLGNRLFELLIVFGNEVDVDWILSSTVGD